jgi:hypothetical protein
VSRRGWLPLWTCKPNTNPNSYTIDISISFVNGHVQSSITVLAIVSRDSITLSTL